MTDHPYAALRDRLFGFNGIVMLLGMAETGKTELAKLIVADAVASGTSVAFVDGDVGSSLAGPPATTGLKYVSDVADLDPSVAPVEMRFVGSTTPQGAMTRSISPWSVGASVPSSPRISSPSGPLAA